MGRVKLARLEYLCCVYAAYSFRGPRSHRRHTILVWYFPGDPVEGDRCAIWMRDYKLHPERYFRYVRAIEAIS